LDEDDYDKNNKNDNKGKRSNSRINMYFTRDVANTFIKEESEKINKLIKESVEKKGYRVSAGYAMVSGDVDLEEAIRISDKRMYEDKSKYYLESGKDRRRR
jgi:hypothetical protein